MTHIFIMPLAPFVEQRLSLVIAINEIFDQVKEISIKTHSITIHHNSPDLLLALGLPEEIHAFGINTGLLATRHFEAGVFRNFLFGDSPEFQVVFLQRGSNSRCIHQWQEPKTAPAQDDMQDWFEKAMK